MKPKLVLLAALAAIAVLTSCPETKVPRQFGLKPALLEPAAWEGDWASPGSPDNKVRFTIKDGTKGTFAVIEPPKDGKKGSSTEVIVSHQSLDKDSRLFFLSTFDKPEDQLGSLNLISKADDNVLYLWGPNHEAIEKAIEGGKLKGTVKKDKDGAHCSLTPDPENYKALASPEFWEWTKPEAFFKKARAKAANKLE